jgi:predicted enzyme related to lactoylglutathione lyase
MSPPDSEGLITFTYYDDLERACQFYGGVMGFEEVIDVDFAKVYKVAENAHIGLVDGKRGSLKPSEDKPVMITVIVDDIDAWHRHLVENGVEIDQPPQGARLPQDEDPPLQGPGGLRRRDAGVPRETLWPGLIKPLI